MDFEITHRPLRSAIALSVPQLTRRRLVCFSTDTATRRAHPPSTSDTEHLTSLTLRFVDNVVVLRYRGSNPSRR